MEPSSRGRTRKNARFVLVAWVLMIALWSRAPVVAEIDDGLRIRIGEAIRRGRESLWSDLARVTTSPPKDHGVGRIAIVLTALLKSGAPIEHPLVRSAVARLERLPIFETYDAACTLFAFDALVRREFAHAWVGSPSAGARPKATGKRAARMRALVAWLIEARAKGRGTWSYEAVEPGSKRHDYSNTQFAVLGLQIGLEHDIPVPREVFEEVVQSFLRGQALSPAGGGVKITFAPDEPKARATKRRGSGRTTTGTSESSGTTVIVRSSPGGWGYRESDTSPYASMSAAGASSLIVAKNGLGKRVPGNLAKSLDAALFSAYAWIATHFDEFLGAKSSYYTLYSLEKVGDLGRVQSFGGKDWYEVGAKWILERQRKDGSWGEYTDTALALLFLTRATRLDVSSPVIYTSGDGESVDEVDPDLVYVPELEGFVSAQETLKYAGEVRDRALLAVVEGVVSHYRPDRRGNLVAPLLELWSDADDRFTRLARESIAEITGLDGRDRALLEAWAKDWQAIEELAASGRGATDEELAERIRSTANEALLERLITVVHRLDRRALALEFIPKLATIESAELRRRLHEYLEIWTAASLSKPGEDPKSSSGEALARRWHDWWNENGERFEARLEARRLIDELESLTRAGILPRGEKLEAEIGGLVDRLVTLGEAARSEVEMALARDDVSFFLIEALERIEGRTIGLAR